MTKLLLLPNEILSTVIDLASTKPLFIQGFHGWPYPQNSYASLKAIALTCRALYIVVAPFLWRDKEFILPRQEDASPILATDILSKRALFQEEYTLGDYVRSLNRDLTHGPHYALTNSQLLARLVTNLKALRIDFHPQARTEEYGVGYFVRYCQGLQELYLTRCRDTFDDFKAVVEANLVSLTLVSCTVKLKTLQQVKWSKLKTLLLQQVLIEPEKSSRHSHRHLVYNSQQLHPFHYQDTASTAIPPSMYRVLIQPNLTHLALSDSIRTDLVQHISQCVHLEKLSLVIEELDPDLLSICLSHLWQLRSLVLLSIAFQRYYPLAHETERIPCHVPAFFWTKFMHRLPPTLKVLSIQATRLLVHKELISYMVKSGIEYVIMSNLCCVQQQHVGKEVREAYLLDCQNLSSEKTAFGSDYVKDYQEVKSQFESLDDIDQVCFVKGY